MQRLILDTSATEHAYRRDIDGLRAVAVGLVLVFHAFPEWGRGGFVGVDVFFVISGYLITTGLLQSLHDGCFSLADFYARRVRRIFPALIAVMIACLAFGWFALLSSEYEQLGKHIAGGAGFVSNFILWNESGYFDNAAETKPLLHLWSLGIEEQYYAFWPLILWTAWRFRLRMLYVIVGLLVLSFLLSIFRLEHQAIARFYSPQTRAWELLAGSLLAWLQLHGITTKSNEWTRLVLSFAGIALIGLAAITLTRESLFPGWWAIPPVLGSALIIAAGPSAALNRWVLSSRPLVAIGLISYPLYLWHWPLLSFARILSSQPPSYPVRLVAVALAIALAWGTYEWIERPIRSSRFKYKITGLVSAMLAVGLLGYSCYMLDGVPTRAFAEPKQKAGDIGPLPYFQYIKERYYSCPAHLESNSLVFEGITRCFQSKQGRNVDLALIGDSHAEHLFLGLAEALPERNVIFLIRDGVPLIRNPKFADIFPFVLTTLSVRTVIITSLWSGRSLEVSSKEDFAAELTRTIEAFKSAGKQLFLTDDIPRFDFDPKLCKYSRYFALSKSECSMSQEQAAAERLAFMPQITSVADRTGVPILQTWRYLCDGGCSMVVGNEVVYRDQNHLNIPGSKYVGHRLANDYPSLTAGSPQQ